MNKNVFKSIGAVLLGFVSIAILAAIIDTILQSVKVLPVTGEKKFEDWQSLLAMSYHLVFVIFGAYLAARLAPTRPMAHALAVGVLGAIISAIGLLAIIKGNLAPVWYGWALIIGALPATWLGGKLFVLRHKQSRK